MASLTKFRQFVEDKNHGVHDLENDQLVLALSNVQPTVTMELLSEITEISYTNCSTRNLTTSSSAQTNGTYKLVCADITLSASGGNVGPFQYVVVYNDTPASPLNPLIGFYDYGQARTLATGESLDVDLDGTNGLLSDT